MAKQEFAGYSPACLQDVRTRLSEVGVSPNEKIGQHFLVNQEAIDLLAQTINPGSSVIEVGCGVGHVTERLVQKATKVYGIEIDRRYRPLLDKLTDRFSNLSIIYRDALAVDFERLWREDRQEDRQVVASLPYHITEPFMQKIAPLRLASLALVVGRRYADSIAASVNSGYFGRLSILTSTFFDVEALATIRRDCFFPVPRTGSAMVMLTPKEEHEFRSNRCDFLLRRLFVTAKRSPLVKNALKEGLIEFVQVSGMDILPKKERHRKVRRTVKVDLRRMIDDYNHFGEAQPEVSEPREAEEGYLTQNQARAIIAKMGITDSILDKPFALLNNSELRMLYEALR